ncbi:MAG TPA: dihydroneopterin aldolase [Niabella sp.]
MAQLITIRLEQLRFFAYHGLYEEEKTTGNEFEMDLEISFPKEDGIITAITETLDYAAVYQLIKEEMQQPRELLETFLTELAEKLKDRFNFITYIKIKLYKLTVPITHFSGKIGVELEKKFE